MISNVTFSDFQDAFRDHGRSDNFTYEGLKALYNHFEELEYSCDTTVELDVVAFCCEYTEYDNLEQLNNEYSIVELKEEPLDHDYLETGNNANTSIDDEDVKEKIYDYVCDRASVVSWADGCYLFSCF